MIWTCKWNEITKTCSLKLNRNYLEFPKRECDLFVVVVLYMRNLDPLHRRETEFACRMQFMSQYRDKRNKRTSVDNMWVKLEENPDNVYRTGRWNRERYISVTYIDNYVYQSDRSFWTRKDTRDVSTAVVRSLRFSRCQDTE